MTYIFLLLMIVVLCFLLIMLVLSQNPKGGGLSGTFGGGGTSMFGVQRTNDFLDKSTWTLAGLIGALIIISTGFVARPDTKRVRENAPTTEQQAPSPDADNETTELPNGEAEGIEEAPAQ